MLVLASDHGGYELKEAVKEHLTQKGIAFTDVGTDSTRSVDYPVYAQKACKLIIDGSHEKGLLFCGTGIGISMAANKIKGIRAAACSDYFSAKATRQHNNANVLCLGGRVVGVGLALELVDVFLETEFEGGRHQNRVDLISQIEENCQ